MGPRDEGLERVLEWVVDMVWREMGLLGKVGGEEGEGGGMDLEEGCDE